MGKKEIKYSLKYAKKDEKIVVPVLSGLHQNRYLLGIISLRNYRRIHTLKEELAALEQEIEELKAPKPMIVNARAPDKI